MSKQPFQPVAGPFEDGTLDEQATHEAFEDYVGGPTRGFQLMRMYQRAGEIVSGDRFSLRPINRTQASVFIKMALREGFTELETKAYLIL